MWNLFVFVVSAGAAFGASSGSSDLGTGTCRDGWISSPTSNACLGVFAFGKSWADARAYCKSGGGDLVKIMDEEMNTFVASLLQKTGKYWIGLHDRVNESKFVWLDETTQANYTNWARGQPNNYRRRGSDQDCAEIGTFKPKWQDDSCRARSKFICERPKPPAECPDDWVKSPVSNTCVWLSRQKAKWANARAVCQAQSGDLVKIPNEEMNNFIIRLLKLKSRSTKRYWIGLHDQVTERRFVWLDEKREANFTKWARDQPNNYRSVKTGDGQDCAEIGTYNLKWQDDWCTRSSYFICERLKRSFAKMTTTSPTVKTTTTVSTTTRPTVKTTTTVSTSTRRPVKTTTTVSTTTRPTVKTTTTVSTTTRRPVKTTTTVSTTTRPTVKTTSTVLSTTRPTVKTTRTTTTTVPSTIPARMSTANTLSTNPSSTTSPVSWDEIPMTGTFIKLYPNKLSWVDARTACQSEGGDLIKIRNDDMNKFVLIFIHRHNSGSHWIGLHDRKEEGKFVWLDEEEEANYTSWAAGQPNNYNKGRARTSGQDCASMATPNLFWQDDVCTRLFSFVCERTVATYVKPSTAAVPREWTESPASGTLVKLHQTMRSWREARAVCQGDEGGDLVKILDDNMNAFVSGLIEDNGGGRYWIGLHDLREESRFVWLDETNEANYTNWAKNQPNNYINNRTKTTGQDCVEMGTFGPRWQDAVCTRLSKFVCERAVEKASRPADIKCPEGWSASPVSGTCVKVYQGQKSWTGARAFCEAFGGDLVKVLNSNMNGFVAGIINKTGKPQFWIGLHNRNGDGNFFWLDDKNKASYTNWAAHQPSSYAKLGDDSTSNKCVVVDTVSQKWRVDGCAKESGFVCELSARTLPAAQRGGGDGGHSSMIIGIVLCVLLVGSAVVFIIIYKRRQASKFKMSSNTTSVSFTNLVNEDACGESGSEL